MIVQAIPVQCSLVGVNAPEDGSLFRDEGREANNHAASQVKQEGHEHS